MSFFGPLDHYPGLLERKNGLIDIHVQLRDRPAVTGIRLWASTHLHHLYGDRNGAVDSLMNTATPPATLAARVIVGRARPNEIVLSNTIQKAGLRFDQATRGTCRFVIDPADVGAPENSVLFAAIQQERASLPVVTVDGFTGRANVVKGLKDIGDDILGPILVIPSPGQMSMGETTLIISGSCPLATAAMGVAGTNPAPDLDLQINNPLHLILPRPTSSVTIRNTDGASALRVSHGLGQQIYEIPLGTARTFFGAVKEVCLQSAAAALCTFSIEANINFGGAAGGI